MKKMKKIILIIVIIFLLFISFFLIPKLLGWLVFRIDCENIILKELNFPDSKYRVISFVRDCGATTDYSVHVSIIERKKNLPNESGNIFIGNHSNFIDTFWEDRNTLVVIHKCEKKDIYKNERIFKGVAIKYQREYQDSGR